jgi:hypothetical protein
MMNCSQLTEDTIRFEDFAASSGAPFVGQHHEVPMNAFGSVVARFEVTDVRSEGAMLIATAKRVS